MNYLNILHIIIIMFNFFIILFVINISTLFILHNKSHNLLKFNKHYLSSKEKETWKNYTIAFISNTIIGVLCTINIITRKQEELNSITLFDKYMYIYCLSYFSYDTYYVNFKIKYKNAMEYNLHHILVLYAIGYTFIYNIYSGYVIWFLTTEISSIFLNIRWFLYKSNYKNNSIQSVGTSVMVILTYTIFRIMQLPYAEYQFIKNYDNSIGSKYYFYRQVSLFIIIYLLNMFWYYNIINKFKKNIIEFILPKPYLIYNKFDDIAYEQNYS